jgi:predicted unusual protein kinase regulating ubiquinone biosynthesis (AarF/ABC1/UbiB family)
LNARRIAQSIEEFPLLRVPRVAEELTRQRVLVLEYVQGRKLADGDGTRPDAAEELWRAYLKQILVDGAFHCDPHPGNFLVDEEGKLAVLDHGMIAYVSRENQLRLMALPSLSWRGTATARPAYVSRWGFPASPSARDAFARRSVSSWPGTPG